MTSTGIVRKIDELGRIIIPKDIWITRDINAKDKLQIEIQNDKIIISRYKTSWILFGENKNIKIFKEKQICMNCIKFIEEHF